MTDQIFNSIPAAVAAYAGSKPDALCCADKNTAFTYRQARNTMGKLAVMLMKLGVTGGDRILVESTQTAAYVIAEMAIQCVGAVFVPVENNASEERFLEIIDETQPVLAMGIRERIPGIPFLSYEGLEPEEEDRPLPEKLPDADDLAEILYTTGTTGKSKGIEITHRNNIAIAENISGSVEMKSDNVEMIPVLMSHSHALRTVYANLLVGGAVLIADGVKFLKPLFELMEKYSATSLDIVPSALRIMLKLSAKKLATWQGRLRYVELGSAPLTELDKKSLRACLPGSRLYNFYGSTESGRTVAYEFSECKPAQGCIGLPAKNTQVLFVDKDGAEVRADSPEHTGYLVFDGPMNMRGYWKAPELTAQVLRNGRILTKDLGYRDEDGLIYMLGRDDDVINCGGVKISPDDVEAACIRCPEVEDCGCIGVDDPLQGQAPMLFVRLKNDSACTEADIMAYMKENFDKTKLPKKVRMIPEIPRTSNGKLLRRELRKLVGM